METTLALDAGIGTGSAALFSGADLIDQMGPRSGISRSETLASSVAELLSRNSIEIGLVANIVVSRGPGSFTGIRLGMGFAQGLADATGAKLHYVSAFDAIAASFAAFGSLLVVVPFGKEDVAVQEYLIEGDRLRPKSELASMSSPQFSDLVRAGTVMNAWIHEESPAWADSLVAESGIHRIAKPETIAAVIGKASIAGITSSEIEPIYLQSSRYQA